LTTEYCKQKAINFTLMIYVQITLLLLLPGDLPGSGKEQHSQHF